MLNKLQTYQKECGKSEVPKNKSKKWYKKIKRKNEQSNYDLNATLRSETIESS